MGHPSRVCTYAAVAMLWGRSAMSQSQPPTIESVESAALVALREAERSEDPQRRAGGSVAEAAAVAGTPLGEASGLDPTLAAMIRMPSIDARMSPRLARSIGLYLHDPRARRVLTSWVRHASQYRARMESILAAEGVPPELVWVAAAESGFDPRSESSVGAGGPWQLMPDAARSYGLRVDAWVDERLDPDRSTHAAARYLRDLHTRFGTWELALAAYNMGYNALLRSIRKYNTNDFDALADLEAGLPWETVHYVPRILAAAVAAANEAIFDLSTVSRDPVANWDDVAIANSLPLADIARESGVPETVLRMLNPALLRSRSPVTSEGEAFRMHVPAGQHDLVSAAVARVRPSPTRAYVVRYGETADEIATRWGIRARNLLSLSGLNDERVVAPGVMLLTPDREAVEPVPTALPVVPMDQPTDLPPGSQRVFVRVVRAEDLGVAARALGVTRTDLARWSEVDPSARMQPGMWLQAWVTSDRSPAVRVWHENEVEIVHRGSEFFHDHAVAATGLVRIRVTVEEGDTLESLASRYATTSGRLARINHRDRHASLAPGEIVVVYTDPAHAGVDANGNPTVPDDHTASSR